MNPVLVAVIVAASGAQESTQHKEIFFNVKNVRVLCEKAICNYLDMPFEVVGHKQLFAHTLNQACLHLNTDNSRTKYELTRRDIQEMLRGQNQEALSDGVKLKLQKIIYKTLAKVKKKIKNEGLESQMEWYKLNYIYNFDLSLWDQTLQIPNFVFTKINSYVKHLDLEKNFEKSDLDLYSSY